MRYTIEIQNEDAYPLDEDVIRSIVETTLKAQHITQHCELTIAIIDDDLIQALNQQFRKINSPTDVLSFPSGEFPHESAYLGDLAIAFPYTEAQAKKLNHTLQDNLGLLVVHGLLHLLGYDHDTEENRRFMWQTQEKILNLLNISCGVMHE